MNPKKHIFLIGFMGVGKTSTARELSRMLGLEEVDTDKLIEQQEKKTIAQIFEQSGEEHFRRLETELLDGFAQRKPCIVSCGGGMAMREENVERMKACGTIVFLTATPETIYSHVKDSTNRPLLNGNMNVSYISELMAQREPKYRAAAEVPVETDGHTPREVAREVMKRLGR